MGVAYLAGRAIVAALVGYDIKISSRAHNMIALVSYSDFLWCMDNMLVAMCGGIPPVYIRLCKMACAHVLVGESCILFSLGSLNSCRG